MTPDRKLIEQHMPGGFIRALLPQAFSRNDMVQALGFPGVSGTTLVSQAKAIQDLHVPLLEAWRDAGILETCKNLGDRKIHRVEAWNSFVRDGLAAVGEYGLADLAMAALPRIASQSAVNDVIRAVGYERDAALDVMTMEMCDIAAKAAEDAIRDVYAGKDMIWLPGTCMQCDMTDARLKWGGTAFAPVLEDENGPVACLERPVVGCHVFMPSSSGTIVLLPSPSSVPEVEQAMEKAIGHSGAFDNSDKGHARKSRILFETFGAVKSTVSACFSSLISYEGIHRFADLRHDHRPDGLSDFRTTLWGPLLIDRDRLAAIVMEASGTDEAAKKSLSSILSDRSTLQIDASEKSGLHVYLPSPGSEPEFGSHFRAKGIPSGKRINDQMILSVAPLDVSPGISRDLDWKGPEMTLDDMRRDAAEKAYEEADFDGLSVGGTSGWENDGADRLLRKVFLETGEQDTVAMQFTVEFPSGSCDPYPADFDLPPRNETPAPC